MWRSSLRTATTMLTSGVAAPACARGVVIADSVSMGLKTFSRACTTRATPSTPIPGHNGSEMTLAASAVETEYASGRRIEEPAVERMEVKRNEMHARADASFSQCRNDFSPVDPERCRSLNRTTNRCHAWEPSPGSTGRSTRSEIGEAGEGCQMLTRGVDVHRTTPQPARAVTSPIAAARSVMLYL